MELRQLRYFLAAARTLNFTRAAQEVHIAQPPLSRQINNLEAELGVLLFERSTRGIRLTPAGLFVQDRATEILIRVDRMKRETSAFQESRRQTVRLAFDVSVLYGRAPAIFKFLRTAYPEFNFEFIEVTSADQPRAIRTGEVDFAVGRVLLRDDQVEQVALRQEPLMLALPAGHSAFVGPDDSVRLSDVRGETFVLYADRANARSLDPVLRFFDLVDFKPAKTISIGDLFAALGLVAAGIGVSVVPATALRMRTDDVCYARLDEAGAVSPIFLSTLRGANSKMIDNILEELKRLAREVADP